jgi:hypothetical protein
MTTFQDNLPRHRRQYAAMRTKRARGKLLLDHPPSNPELLASYQQQRDSLNSITLSRSILT